LRLLASSAFLRRERMQARAVLMEVRSPRIPDTATIHRPKPNFCCSQVADNKKKHSGNNTESPNCVTHSNKENTFIRFTCL